MSSTTETTMSNQEKEDQIVKYFGHFLSTSMPIVENILKFLQPRQLSECASVCSLWAAVSRSIKLKHPPQPYHYFAVRDLEEGRRSDEEFFEVGNKLYTLKKDVWHPPKVALFFGSKSIISDNAAQYFSEYKASRKRCLDDASEPRFKNSVLNHISTYLPADCYTIFGEAWGLLGTEDGPGFVAKESCMGDGVSALFLPTMPGVDIYAFSTPGAKTVQKLIREADGDVSEITGIPSGEQVKALIVLEQGRDSGINSILDYYLARNECNFAIGGAVVRKLRATRDRWRSGDSAQAVGIAFCGSGVRAASVLLDPDVRGEADVEKALEPLKDFHYPEGWRCVALFFACCARGEQFHQKPDLETAVFCRMFPGIPVVGLFGNGEFGHTFVPPWDGSGNTHPGTNVRSSHLDQLINFPYGYCTAVLMLAFCSITPSLIVDDLCENGRLILDDHVCSSSDLESGSCKGSDNLHNDT